MNILSVTIYNNRQFYQWKIIVPFMLYSILRYWYTSEADRLISNTAKIS